ncbi:MAG TPA: c-type cytochrome [Steroidobacteraceae bacterium]|nr:c-type cytochrome [Steroidobacteraceae bacterium]
MATRQKPGGVKHRHKLWFGVVGASALVLAGVAAGFVILLSGGFSTAATTQHFWITHRLLDIGLSVSVNAAASHIKVPALTDPTMIAQGMACYRMHCIDCHGAPGEAPAAAGRGMLPVPAPLSQATRDWSTAALYYITKKGVRMTGMPAWEFRMSEHSLWSTVALLAAMPQLSISQFDDLKARSQSSTCPVNTVSPQTPYPDRGEMLLRQYACHSCHRIEGVTGPKTYAGPELNRWSERKYIAGVLPNTRQNLTQWIHNPQSVNPLTMMPNLAVPESHAEEIARYLLAPR